MTVAEIRAKGAKMNESSLGMPTRPSEITLDWLNKVLGAQDIPTISMFSLEPIEAGFYGSLARIDVAYNFPTSAPHTYIAKFAAEDLAVREALSGLGIYECEYNFYTKLSAKSPIRTAKCFVAHFEPEGQELLLLMEWIEGTVFDDMTGATFEQAELAFSEASRLHKHWLGDPILNEPWIHPIGGPPLLDKLIAASEHAIPEGAKLVSECCPDWLLDNAGRGHEIIRDQLVELNSLPHTLIHLDYRLSNMIFSGDADESITLIDWQSVLRAPGVCDVAFFATIGLTVSDRREWENELVRRYLQSTHGWSEDIWPAWFEMAWCRMSLFGAFNCLRNVTVMDMTNPTTKAFMCAWIERTCAAAEDHNALQYL
jgi:hypothetical protein